MLSLSAAAWAALYAVGGGDDEADEEVTTVFKEGGSKLQLFQDESLVLEAPAGKASEEWK